MAKYYRSDEQIPVTDDITLEAVKGRYGIKITDEKGVEHLLRQGTYILNLGDCGDIYYATGSEFILTLEDAKLRSIECDMDLTLRLLGSSSIAAKGDEDAIRAGSLCISTLLLATDACPFQRRMARHTSRWTQAAPTSKRATM